MLHGLVAQLGAHHIRIVGVEGSNPFKSTKRKATSDEVAFLLVWDRRRRDSNNLIRLAGGKPGGECPHEPLHLFSPRAKMQTNPFKSTMTGHQF